MNMHLQPQRTQAETALIDAFGERQSFLPGDGAVMSKRDEAVEAIKHGLPTRRIETWHYTDLRRLLTTVPAYDDSARASALAPLVEGSPVLALLNGAVSKPVAIEGVTVSPVADKLSDGTYAPALGAQAADDAIGALNSAFVADGWLLTIDGLIQARVPGGAGVARIDRRLGPDTGINFHRNGLHEPQQFALDLFGEFFVEFDLEIL